MRINIRTRKKCDFFANLIFFLTFLFIKSRDSTVPNILTTLFSQFYLTNLDFLIDFYTILLIGHCLMHFKLATNAIYS